MKTATKSITFVEARRKIEGEFAAGKVTGEQLAEVYAVVFKTTAIYRNGMVVYEVPIEYVEINGKQMEKTEAEKLLEQLKKVLT